MCAAIAPIIHLRFQKEQCDGQKIWSFTSTVRYEPTCRQPEDSKLDVATRYPLSGWETIAGHDALTF